MFERRRARRVRECRLVATDTPVRCFRREREVCPRPATRPSVRVPISVDGRRSAPIAPIALLIPDQFAARVLFMCLIIQFVLQCLRGYGYGEDYGDRYVGIALSLMQSPLIIYARREART